MNPQHDRDGVKYQNLSKNGQNLNFLETLNSGLARDTETMTFLGMIFAKTFFGAWVYANHLSRCSTILRAAAYESSDFCTTHHHILQSEIQDNCAKTIRASYKTLTRPYLDHQQQV